MKQKSEQVFYDILANIKALSNLSEELNFGLLRAISVKAMFSMLHDHFYDDEIFLDETKYL